MIYNLWPRWFIPTQPDQEGELPESGIALRFRERKLSDCFDTEDYKNMRALQERIGYSFQDRKLLVQAMTHSSYANEHRKSQSSDQEHRKAQDCDHEHRKSQSSDHAHRKWQVEDNERLEFLGDAVLEMVSSVFLFQTYPEMPEGNMTKLRASLVCEPTLAMCARAISLPDCLRLGKGEELTGGRMRNSIVSDAMEALIGAIFLDGGLEPADRFIRQFILNDIEHKKLFSDSKTLLQEVAQKDWKGQEIVYELTGEDGPDHQKQFHVQIRIGTKVMGTGVGHTKKAAEQEAAYNALLKLHREQA